MTYVEIFNNIDKGDIGDIILEDDVIQNFIKLNEDVVRPLRSKFGNIYHAEEVDLSDPSTLDKVDGRTIKLTFEYVEDTDKYLEVLKYIDTNIRVSEVILTNDDCSITLTISKVERSKMYKVLSDHGGFKYTNIKMLESELS